MTIKNGNMPAMPINDRYKLESDGKPMSGLSKREHFASLSVPPQEVLIETLKQAFPDGFTPKQYIEMAVGYKVDEADALLESLEESK